jgi:RND family efflux transporter MFP subunit
MDNIVLADEKTAERTQSAVGRAHPRRRWGAVAAIAIFIAVLGIAGEHYWAGGEQTPAPPPPPQVTVSRPLQMAVQPTGQFLGQFSAVDSVELRAQVGGTLTAIQFRDGQIVHKDDPLFLIDPRPFKIELEQALAQLQTAQAKEALSEAELWRAQQLKRTDFGTAESVDQRDADKRSSQAAIQTADAAISNAELDLEYSRITAPFTGRIGAHLVSVGSLVSGSRGGTSPTTLLATIVSLDPIYLDFDMSESDYAAYQKVHHGTREPHDDVAISIDGDGNFNRHGTLDFIDNAVNRGSGTIHARATVPNPDLSITPGQFARLRVTLGQPEQALLVPASAVVPDQSQHIVMTVAPDRTVVPKQVEIGELYDGLRAIRGGLAPTDSVVINGLVRVRPGAKVTPVTEKIAPDTSGDTP